MDRYEGSSAVSNARGAILILAWIFLIAGVVVAIIGLTADYFVEWEIVIAGAALILYSTLHFIANAILKGFEHVVKASEIYMSELDKKNEEKTEEIIKTPLYK